MNAFDAAAGLTSRTRFRPLPLIVTVPPLALAIVRSPVPVSASSPAELSVATPSVVILYVPATVRLIVFGPDEVLAACSADRSVTVPAGGLRISARLVTL